MGPYFERWNSNLNVIAKLAANVHQLLNHDQEVRTWEKAIIEARRQKVIVNLEDLKIEYSYYLAESSTKIATLLLG